MTSSRPLLVAVAFAAAVSTGAGAPAAEPPAPPAPEDHLLRPGGEVLARPGERALAELTIAPAEGYTLHEPVALRLATSPAEGLRLPRRRLGRRDAADPRATSLRFDLPVVAERPGHYRLTVDARFWVCARRTCRPVRAKAEIPVVVAEEAPPAAAPDAG